jgi:hypothetical protein
MSNASRRRDIQNGMIQESGAKRGQGTGFSPIHLNY